MIVRCLVNYSTSHRKSRQTNCSSRRCRIQNPSECEKSVGQRDSSRYAIYKTKTKDGFFKKYEYVYDDIMIVISAQTTKFLNTEPRQEKDIDSTL